VREAGFAGRLSRNSLCSSPLLCSSV